MTNNEPNRSASPWLIPETAPKDGTLFLGDFGWPVALMTTWDAYGEEWTYAMPQTCQMEDGGDNRYFETETERDGLRAWMPLPKLPEPERRDE